MNDVSAQKLLQNSPKSITSLMKLLNQLRVSENVTEQMISTLNIVEHLGRNERFTGSLRDHRIVEILFKILAHDKHS